MQPNFDLIYKVRDTKKQSKNHTIPLRGYASELVQIPFRARLKISA